jgi:hypothetical protein
MIIWRVDGWKAEKQITEPFSKAPDSIMFKRPSWSSDGFILIGAAAMMSGSHTPLLIEREKWTFGHYAVGHRGFVTATAANPSVFVDGSGAQPFLCYALADVNQMVTIWVTKQEHAVAVIAHAMDRPITDLRWSREGNVLLIASLDGTVMVVHFADDEIGKKMSEDEKESRLREQYGAGGAGAVFEDPALLALYQQKRAKQAEEAAAAASASSFAQQEARSQPTAAVQTETIVKGGKRKIVPVLVSGVDTAPARVVDPSDAFKSVFATGNITPIKSTASTTPTLTSGSQPANGGFSSSTTPTSLPTSSSVTASNSNAMDIDTPNDKKRGRPSMASTDDLQDDLARKKSASTATSSSAAASTSTGTSLAHSTGIGFASPSAPIGSSNAAQVNRLSTAGTPTAFTPVSGGHSSVTPQKADLGLAATQSPSQHGLVSAPISVASFTPGGSSAPSGGAAGALSPPASSALSIMRATAKRAGRPRGRPPKSRQAQEAEEMDMDTEDSHHGGASGGSATERASAPRLLLPLPLVQKRFAKDIKPPSSTSTTNSSNAIADRFSETWTSAPESLMLEVIIDVDEDGIRPPKSTVKYISKFYDSLTLLWQDHVEDKVTALTGNATHLMALGCDSGDVYIYTASGRRAFPAINISSTAICALECHDSTLMAVSCDGIIKVWDISLGIAKADTNLHSLMAKHAATQVDRPNEPVLGLQSANQPDDGSIILQDFVSRFAVSETGQALCLMHSGHIFGYSTMLASWTCLYAPNWQKDVDKSGVVLGQLSALQRTSQRTRNTGSTSGYTSFHGLGVEERRQRSVAHLESQVSSAALFGTIDEYRHFAKLYVRELAELCNEKKLADFTKTLLGPIHHTARSSGSWDPFIHGVPKREILDEVLPEMLRPELQRLIATIKEDLQSARQQEAASRVLRSPVLSRHSVGGAVAAAAAATSSSATPSASGSSHLAQKGSVSTPTAAGKQSAKHGGGAGPSSSSAAHHKPGSAAPSSSTATASTPSNKSNAKATATTASSLMNEDVLVIPEEHSQQSTSSTPGKNSRSSSSVGKGKRSGNNK